MEGSGNWNLSIDLHFNKLLAWRAVGGFGAFGTILLVQDTLEAQLPIVTIPGCLHNAYIVIDSQGTNFIGNWAARDILTATASVPLRITALV